MLNQEIEEYDCQAIGHFMPRMKEKVRWLYIVGVLSQKDYFEFICKIENKYQVCHNRIFKPY